MQDVPGGQSILPLGSVVRGHYIIEGLLGKGGFGAVYLVRDEQADGKLFALKEIIDPSKRARDYFTFECEVLRRCCHPALPRVHDVFEDERNNRAYMLMDYIEGPNLERLRQQQPQRRFTLSQVMTMIAPIVDVITYLHNQHPPIIHRDIKPANIIIPTSGAGAILVDFGIAKEYDPDATTTAMRHCSPGYSAPEQYTRGTDARTDIYALGATFYTLLTGILPTNAIHRLTHVASRGTDPLKPVTQLVPTLPTSLQKAIRRALALNSDDRFATADEFWQAVLAHSVGVSSPAPVVAPDGFPTQQSVGRAFVHLPAVAAPRTSLHLRRTRRTKRPYALALSLVGFAVFALLAGFVFKASFWSTGGSFNLPTPTDIVQSECEATISPTTGTTVTSPSTTATSQSSCKVIITPITGPTVTRPTPESTVTAPTPGPILTALTPGPTVTRPTPGPIVTAPTPGPTVTRPTPGPIVTAPTPGPIVVHPSTEATPTVPPQLPPTLMNSSGLTSSPSGLILISQGNGKGNAHSKNKKHRRDKKNENEMRGRNHIHRNRRTRFASCG